MSALTEPLHFHYIKRINHYLEIFSPLCLFSFLKMEFSKGGFFPRRSFKPLYPSWVWEGTEAKKALRQVPLLYLHGEPQEGLGLLV